MKGNMLCNLENIEGKNKIYLFRPSIKHFLISVQKKQILYFDPRVCVCVYVYTPVFHNAVLTLYMHSHILYSI